ncbi:MAG: hypothetical protein ACTSQA_02545 [Candidatus Heimdallarchaeaceae archaeon]
MYKEKTRITGILMNYINILLQKTFKRRIGKNVGTLIAIALGVSLMVGVQITITIRQQL